MLQKEMNVSDLRFSAFLNPLDLFVLHCAFAVLLLFRRATMSVKVDHLDISDGWMGGVKKVTELTKVVSWNFASGLVACSQRSKPYWCDRPIPNHGSGTSWDLTCLHDACVEKPVSFHLKCKRSHLCRQDWWVNNIYCNDIGRKNDWMMPTYPNPWRILQKPSKHPLKRTLIIQLK